ncbi:hypothetical protein TNCT_138231 [Trichonephila clavata]|uniref:Uncharacterized protein n=1 Tax=Trichonephila clavata TaxID=2740835 RepID=A0A8X6LE80_TRICU|nr:hypothetical protein TNCT_138231 [Trichonephila clavata]
MLGSLFVERGFLPLPISLSDGRNTRKNIVINVSRFQNSVHEGSWRSPESGGLSFNKWHLRISRTGVFAHPSLECSHRHWTIRLNFAPPDPTGTTPLENISLCVGDLTSVNCLLK